MPTTAVSLNQVVQRTLDFLREVPGISVQTYSEPRIQRLAQSVFDLVFEQAWIPDLCEWQTIVLDGTTGKPTTNLTIRSFQDIRAFYREGQQYPLPLLPRSMNPDVVTGTVARFVDPLRQPETGATTKIFRVLPIASAGSVTFYARYHPGDQTSTPDTAALYIDKDLIALGCTYMSLEQDGSNPGATQMYQGLFENKLNTIKAAYSSAGVPLTAQGGSMLEEWVQM